MIVNLAATTRKNTDQDWLKTNIAKFTRMVQGQRDLLTVAKLLLSELAPLVSAQRGTLLHRRKFRRGRTALKFMAGYAYRRPRRGSRRSSVSARVWWGSAPARNSAFWCATSRRITFGSGPAWVRLRR